MYVTVGPSVGTISAGALLGTSGTADLVSSINNTFGQSNFLAGLPQTFRDIRNTIMVNMIQPIQQGREMLTRRVNMLLNPDFIRPLIEQEDFKSVPPSMYLPIVMYAPVRTLLEQGKIHGFGINPDHIPEEDVYGRLINNGTVDDVLAAADKDGQVWLTWEWWSTDPNLSFGELDAIEDTRAAISRMLADTPYDPTDYPEERG